MCPTRTSLSGNIYHKNAGRVVRGGQLKDNKDSWFVDMESLYKHIESQCFKPDRAKSKETEQNIVDFVRRMT